MSQAPAPELLEILVCPRCKGAVQYRPDDSALDCAACRLRFRVEDGIPVMLVSEATKLV
ncbi:MAG: Trm112 family protein [Candidatus Dormibacteria bacterium]